MRSPSRLLLIAAGLLALALAIVVTVARPGTKPAGPATSGTGPAANSGFDGFQLPQGASLPDVALTDQNGTRVTLSEAAGRLTVLAFLNTACGANCVVTAEQIRGALDELGPKRVPVRVLLLSTDPPADTPAAVARFLDGASLAGRVHYLTGPAPQLRSIARSFGAETAGGHSRRARAARPGRRSAPPSFTYVVLADQHGVARVGYTLEQLTPEALVHDIRRLQGG